MYQELLLKQIRSKIGDKSLNDEIANVLNISYDASHRRTSMKSKFSLEESLVLAKFYNISLDSFMESDKQIIAKKTKPIRTVTDLLNYFDDALHLLNDFKINKETEVYYSAKDIPFFYTISDSVLSRFKLFVWMNLLNEKDFMQPFDDFKLERYSDKSEDLKSLYENLNVTEIWNNTTISSILNQVLFYSEIEILSKETAKLILEELKILIKSIEKKAENENKNFHIYAHDILILNNSILFKNEEKSSLFVPYNMFGYMMTDDQSTCDDALNFFQHQIKNSTSLSFSGQRDRKKFFNSMLERIESLKNSI
ncbi:XRE family transcriptional regulator [Epilithonimonas sp. JDS]|uniref:XRE family transcriptional regulator n=1 Tax=Epilithonimonas sp. JDS TaxID=2902797 RepID=UPI001E59505A|nr:XRE family transcriptional regulator [Epilithonimonas sp. JDS]MCD9856194.1 XRE family transcriptional regulator [Epilithonimonas sp. JDS]